MIDLNLFATLIRSINWNSVQRLILVGDPNQLPPIGRGKVFSDTIEWLNQEYPENVGVLCENIRQLVNRVEGNGCGILDLAELFIQEKQSDMEDTGAADTLKQKKEELFTKIMENGNGDIDKDLAVYFWKEQADLETLLRDVLTQDMEAIIRSLQITVTEGCLDGGEGRNGLAVALQLALTFLIGCLNGCLDLCDRSGIGLRNDERHAVLRSATVDTLRIPDIRIAPSGVYASDYLCRNCYLVCHDFFLLILR